MTRQSFEFIVGFTLPGANTGLAGKIIWLDTSIQHSLGRTISKSTAKHGPALAAQVERLLGWKGNVTRDLRCSLIIAYAIEQNEPQLKSAFYRGTKLRLTQFF